MTNNSQIKVYGHCYQDGKSYFRKIKSDFDIVRELDKLHKKTLSKNNKISMLTLMCQYFHGQPYK